MVHGPAPLQAGSVNAPQREKDMKTFIRRRQETKRYKRKQKIRELREGWKVEPYPDTWEKLAWIRQVLETERDKRARWRREGLCRKCGSSFRDLHPCLVKITDLCERCRVGEVVYRKRMKRLLKRAEELSKYIRALVDH